MIKQYFSRFGPLVFSGLLVALMGLPSLGGTKRSAGRADEAGAGAGAPPSANPPATPQAKDGEDGVDPAIGKPAVSYLDSGRFEIKGIYVSLRALTAELSTADGAQREVHPDLATKRIHLFGRGFPRADLAGALAHLAAGRWRGRDQGIRLEPDPGATKLARRLRETRPEYSDEALQLDENTRLNLTAGLIEAAKNPASRGKLAGSLPHLARDLERKQILRAGISALGQAQPYERMLMSGHGLRISGSDLNGSDREALLQAGGSFSEGVSEVSWVGSQVDRERIHVFVYFKNFTGGSVVLHESASIAAEPAGKNEASADLRKVPENQPDLPDLSVRPHDLVVLNRRHNPLFDWPATLRQLSLKTGLLVVSDVEHRPLRRGESLRRRFVPARKWSYSPHESIPLREFLPDLANRAGFTLSRQGDIIVFRHQEWFWESQYRYGDEPLRRLAAADPKLRTSLDFTHTFLKLGPGPVEGLSLPFSALRWIASNPDGGRLFALLNDAQRIQLRSSGLPFTALGPLERAHLWRWQRIPPAVAPLRLRRPLKLISFRQGDEGEGLDLVNADQP